MIAIHYKDSGFTPKWIQYCETENIPFKIVNAFDSNIIEQLNDCQFLLWHHYHSDYKERIVAEKILFALEHAGIKVFPNWKTAWYFDDKVAQKYLLEAIKIPMVPSYVFYDKQKALDWINHTEFPKVWKLRGGAGSQNVRLIRSREMAVQYVKKAFGRGFSVFNRFEYVKERFRNFREGNITLGDLIKSSGRLIIPRDITRYQKREKGYIYFQEFIPNLDSDVRIQVIGGRLFGLKRFVRKNDFRASGSGNFVEFNSENIDINVLRTAVRLASIIDAQSLTIDFIYKNGKPLVVELSYGFPVSFYDNCTGYWDSELNWIEGEFSPHNWMIEDLINQLK